jgi:putative spermidine/putrescine transport system permease protein
MKKFNFAQIITGIVYLYLLIPLVLTFSYSLASEWIDILPTGLTFKYYMRILPRQDFYSAISRTLILCVVAVVLSGAVMLFTMYVVIVHYPKLDRYVQIVCMVPYALQGIIIAISILTLYSGSRGVLGNRMMMLIGTYCIIILPYMYQGIRNSLRTVNAKQLIEAAQILGTTKLYAFFRVVVPNILSGIIISSMLSMGIIFGDFVVVNIIAGSSYQTVSMFLYKMIAQSGQTASVIIVVMFIVTLVLSLITFKLRNKNHSS